MSPSPLSAGGLVLEIAGAIELASAYAFKRPRDIRFESRSYWNYNMPLLVSLAKQTADAWIGGILLVLGFAAQFESALGASVSSVVITVPVAVGIAVGAHIALRVWLRPWSVRRVMADIDAIEQQTEELNRAMAELSRTQSHETREGNRPPDAGA
jgi:hypothetical protein